MRTSLIAFATLGLAATVAPSATAQSIPGSAYLDALKACQVITAEAGRLACFDREVASVVGANDSGAVQIVGVDEIRETRRGLFGFSLPKIKLFGQEEDAGDESLETLESTIVSARQFKADGWVFQIADGDAVWQINDAPARLRDIKSGDDVVFKKASLGTYFIRINGQIGVKGRRVQ